MPWNSFLDMVLCAFGESVCLRAEAEGSGLHVNDRWRRGPAGGPSECNHGGLVVSGDPNDWPAVLKYMPVELAWFLLKHVAIHGPVGQQPEFSPFRSGIASLAQESWAQLG